MPIPFDREEGEVKYLSLSRIMCPGYEVGTDGSVLGAKTGRPLKTYRHQKSGRVMVAVKDWQGKRRGFAVARLVLDLFRGRRSKGWEPVHLDGKTDDCALANLRWRKKREPNRKQSILVVRAIIAKHGLTPDEVFPPTA